MTRSQMPRLLTVDMEDYFHASVYRRAVAPRHWPHLESRLERNTMAMLDLLDERGAKATFFVLGWVAEKRPDLVRAVSVRGHEIAVKCYLAGHIASVGFVELERRLEYAKNAVEQACGIKVLGNRFSIAASQPELDVLELVATKGFKYDSSVLARTGIWSAQFVNFGGAALFEVPIGSSLLEDSSGLKTWLHQQGSAPRKVVQQTDSPIRIHLWELDQDRPRLNGSHSPSVRNTERLQKERVPRGRFVTVSRFLGLSDQRMQARIKPAPRVVNAPVRQAIVTSAGAKTPITLVIPCFNEHSSLTYLQSALRSFEEAADRDYSTRFIFVDDGSTDGTHNKLQRLFGLQSNALIIPHATNKGVAASILTGICKSQSEIVCSMDSDCTYDPLELLTMIPQLRDGVDLVTASPYHPLGSVRNVPGWRLTLSKGSSFLYRLVLRQKLFTFTSCFRVYRRSAVMNLQLQEPGYLGVAEMATLLALRGSQIREHPAILESRILGTSKMKVLRTIAGHLRLLSRIVRVRFAQRFLSPHEMPKNALAASIDFK